MSKYITQRNDISTYLEFSNLQIASEAFIGDSQSKEPGTIIAGDIFERDNLIDGNKHTSKHRVRLGAPLAKNSITISGAARKHNTQTNTPK